MKPNKISHPRTDQIVYVIEIVAAGTLKIKSSSRYQMQYLKKKKKKKDHLPYNSIKIINEKNC